MSVHQSTLLSATQAKSLSIGAIDLQNLAVCSGPCMPGAPCPTVTGRVVVHAPASTVEERIGPWTQGSIEPLGDDRCRVQIGARSPEDIAFWLGVLDADFEVEDSPELADAVRRVSERYARAAG